MLGYVVNQWKIDLCWNQLHFFLSSNGYPVFKIQNIKLLPCKNTNVLQVYPLVILLQLSQLVEVKTLIGCMAGSLFCITLVVLNGVLCQVMSARNLKKLNLFRNMGSGQFVEWINTCHVAYDQFCPLTGKVYIIRY